MDGFPEANDFLFSNVFNEKGRRKRKREEKEKDEGKSKIGQIEKVQSMQKSKRRKLDL